MNAELKNEQEQSGHSESDEYAAAFDEAATDKKEPSHGEDSGSWIPGDDAAGQSNEEAATKEKEYTPETADPDNPPEELKDHPYYKSIKGRIDQQRRRADELEARLREVEAERPRQQQQPQAPIFERAEIPEDLKEDVDAFKKAYPEYADVIEMKGKTGDRIRKLLSDYGGEVAAVQADNFILMSEVRASKAEISKKIGEYEGNSFEQRIYTDHPDFKLFDKQEKNKFLDEVKSWIEDQPFKEAKKWDRIYDKGTAAELSELFTVYKKNKQTPQTNQNSSTNKRRQAIDDGLAVPSSARGAIRKPPERAKEDYAGAFEEACAS